MCGIGLIVSGMELEGKSVSVAEEMFGNGSLTADHLMKALQSRGPDCVGRHTITLRGAESEHQVVLRTDGEDKCVNSSIDDEYSQVTLDFVGSSLQLRGALSISQPFRDSHNNVLVYNDAVLASAIQGVKPERIASAWRRGFQTHIPVYRSCCLV